MSLELPLEATVINKQVERIISSPGFKNSFVISEFLKFIVAETLADRQESLKEYVIATQVLKKKTDFNPQLDAIVRIHARRLRMLLADYYGNMGIQDPVKIFIPKGRYVPVFEVNHLHLESATIHRETTDTKQEKRPKPKLAILPFINYNQNRKCEMFGSALRHDLSIELTHFQELGVISNISANIAFEKIADIHELALHLGIDYLLTGSCFGDEQKLKITVELTSTRDMEQLWAKTYHMEISESDPMNGYPLIIREIVSFIAGSFGLIYRDMMNKIPDILIRDYSYVYAIYMYNYYLKNFSLEANNEVLKHLHQAHLKNPQNALLPAFIGQVSLNYILYNATDKFDPIREGLFYLQKAIQIDPQCQEAYKGIAWASLLLHDKKGFVRAAEKCISINPSHATMIGDMGFGYICAGEFEKGLAYQLDAVELNPYYPWFFCLGFCFYYMVNEEYKEAYFWAQQINRPGIIWDPLIKASVYGLANKMEEAVEHCNLILQMVPDFQKQAKKIISTFLFSAELIQTIITGLKNAGIKMDD